MCSCFYSAIVALAVKWQLTEKVTIVKTMRYFYREIRLPDLDIIDFEVTFI